MSVDGQGHTISTIQYLPLPRELTNKTLDECICFPASPAEASEPPESANASEAPAEPEGGEYREDEPWVIGDAGDDDEEEEEVVVEQEKPSHGRKKRGQK